MKKKQWILVLLTSLFILAMVAVPAYADESRSDTYAAYVGGGDVGIVDATGGGRAFVHECGDAVDFSWMEWWKNWNIQEFGMEKVLQEALGYEGTTQISADGKYVCYASGFANTASYRLMALTAEEPQKPPVKIGDDAAMHRMLADNRVVWLKSSNGTLYISDMDGNTEVIASNVEHYPFFVNAEETHVLWVERGTTRMWMRSLDMKGEAASLNWDQVYYMTSDLSMLIGSREGKLYVRENFGEEKLFFDSTEYVTPIEPEQRSSEPLFAAGKPVGCIIESDCRYFQASPPGGKNTGIWKYENGQLNLFIEGAVAVGVHGDMIAYKKPGQESGADYETQTTYLWANGKESPLENQKISNIYFSGDGTKAWGLGNKLESVYLLSELQTENPDGKLRVVSENVLYFSGTGQSRCYYAESDEMDVNIVLRDDQNVIDYDGTTSFIGKDDRFYYRVGQDIVFTLKVYDGAQSEVIADNVIEAKALKNGSVLVLVSANYETQYGTLYLYTKESGLTELVSGVAKIAGSDISIRYPQDDIMLSAGSSGSMQLLAAARSAPESEPEPAPEAEPASEAKAPVKDFEGTVKYYMEISQDYPIFSFDISKDYIVLKSNSNIYEGPITSREMSPDGDIIYTVEEITRTQVEAMPDILEMAVRVPGNAGEKDLQGGVGYALLLDEFDAYEYQPESIYSHRLVLENDGASWRDTFSYITEATKNSRAKEALQGTVQEMLDFDSDNPQTFKSAGASQKSVGGVYCLTRENGDINIYEVQPR